MTRHTASLSGLLAALLIAGAPAALAQDAAKASRFYEDALQRYEKRDIPGAIIQLKNALQADKSQLSVHVLLGKALLADSQPAAAEFEFSEAIRMGVNRAEVAVPLAMALSAQGKQPQVLEDPRVQAAGLPPGIQQQLLLERALAQSDLGDTKAALASVLDARALNTSEVNGWLAEVPLRVRSRQFAEAHAAADQALKLAPDNAEALYQKASIHHASGQIVQALALYERAIKADPKHAEAHLARAGLLVDLNRDGDALAEVNELQALKPNDPRGSYLRAILAERANDPATSRAALKKVTDLLDPAPIEYIRYRTQLLMLNGLAHYSLGELEKAKPFLELASRQQPGSPLIKLLAQVALKEPNFNRAVELLEAYVKVRPGDGQALLMLASAHMNQGRHARAVALMQDALKAKDSPEYRTALGLSLLQSGKAAPAAEELAKAYKADPKQTYAGLALITLYLREEQPAKALAVAENLARANPNNATVLMVQAYAKTQSGDYPGGRAGYEKALKLDPKLLEARLGLVRIDTVTGNFDAANKRLREALKSDERNTHVLFELALLHERWGKDDEALKWLESAAEASGARETRANFALVAWHLRKGQPARAVVAAKALLAKLPEDVEALQAYAGAQAANGDAAGAKSTLTNAARRAAFDAPRLLEVARQQVSIKDYSGAAYSLDKALSGNPDFMPAMAMLSSIDLAQGDAAKAEQRARQVIQSAPKAAIGYNLLAEVATYRGQATTAIDALRKAHDVEKSQASMTRLMRAVGKQSGPKAAIELGETWLKRNPSDLAVRSAIAEQNIRAHDYAAARKQYESILKQRPNHAETLNNLANVLMETKDPGAVDMAERAYKVDVRNPKLMDTAGWANHLAGKGERALQLLREARLRAPDEPEIRYHLAAVLAKAGRKGEAKEELNAALRPNVSFASLEDARKLLVTLN
ncbi:putative PEP-CTERM system TPR-repeat lipoprotein [Pelomonas saccharophila]|uniref:PEP-CTERM system TPR-repeat lipoprotein n=1 Tax=Roseateles saccharophilus TaxID=304 RepID=A0ABU1YFL3_ROSSA|nr:XrtA/PEP-CTERM system TPR-repeat protein PrsT [Roseateles saccharophilus]MDR7267608.1 putative PEP-CTERM system TPR-repeat lipoprotein [Roseateles saccharophilus]